MRVEMKEKIIKDNKYEEKFLVCKWEDLYENLSEEEYMILLILIQKGIKDPHKQYLVVNQDEPYAENVWNLIKENLK